MVEIKDGRMKVALKGIILIMSGAEVVRSI